MNIEFDKLKINKNEVENRFELNVEGFISFIDYIQEGNVVKLIHTEVAEELAGRGVGSALVEKTLTYLEEHQHPLLPYCPFVFAYIKRHPEWKRIVDKSFPKYNEL